MIIRDKRGRFIAGGKGHFGYKHSEETKGKIKFLAKQRLLNKENHPMYNKNHSIESKRVMSETRKRLFREGKIIHPRGMLGKKGWSGGLNKDIDDRLKKQGKKSSITKKQRFKDNPKLRIKMREIRLNQIFPQKDTQIEIKVQDKLRLANVSFRTHEPILGQPDIFIEPNICIFVDGCYWHSCERCYDRNKFSDKQRLQIIKDNMITQKLIEQNYIVLRLWEHDIKRNIDLCLLQIKDLLKLEKVIDYG